MVSAHVPPASAARPLRVPVVCQGKFISDSFPYSTRTQGFVLQGWGALWGVIASSMAYSFGVLFWARPSLFQEPPFLMAAQFQQCETAAKIYPAAFFNGPRMRRKCTCERAVWGRFRGLGCGSGRLPSGDLRAHRLRNFTGAMLRHHSLKSTMYLSKWIELKESGLSPPTTQLTVDSKDTGTV